MAVVVHDGLLENPFGCFSRLCYFLAIDGPGPDARKPLEEYVVTLFLPDMAFF